MADPVTLENPPATDPVRSSQPAPIPKVTPAYVREKFTDSARSMRYEQYSYVRNLSFLDGQQWIYWDRQRNVLQEYPRQGTRTRLTVNKLRPATRNLMSRLLSKPLQFQVPPGDSDDASVRGAHTSEAILADLHDEHDWESLREESLMAALLGGTAILAVDWNPKMGVTIGHLPITGEEFGTGEVEETALSIAEVAWEPGSVTPERSNWWIRAQVLPPQQVRERYNLSWLPAADATSLTTPLSHIASRTQRESGPQNLTLVLTYYERPNNLRKQGAICTVVNDRFVEETKPWYFPFKDRLNFTIIRETKVPRQGTGKTVFSDCIGLQTALNACWSNMIEHMKYAGNLRLLLPEGSLDSIEDLSDLPGEIIQYNAATGEPKFLSPANMPQWWAELPMKLSAEIDNALNLHDASRGITPPNIESGVGLSILIEQDQTPLGKLTAESARAFQIFATMVLEIYQVFVKEPRKSYINNGHIAECVEWDGKALQGQIKPVVPLDSIMPRSKAASYAMARDLLDRKLISTIEEFVSVADMVGGNDIIAEFNADLAKAERENSLMAAGEIPIPEDFDNHEIHIKAHNKFRKSVRYNSLKEREREIFAKHIQAHEVLAAEQMGMMVAKANANPALPAIPTANESAPLPPGVPGALPPAPVSPETAPPPGQENSLAAQQSPPEQAPQPPVQ